MLQPLEGLYDFLNGGVSPYHSAAQAAALLEKAGFQPLREEEIWHILPGGKYYVQREGTSVAAFVLPEEPLKSWRLTVSHGDSPALRVKATEVSAPGNTIRLEVEPYGGLLMNTWFDRPLTVAGRLLVRGGDGLLSRLVWLDRDLCIIPSLAIHMDKAANEGHKVQPQSELQPLLGLKCEVTLRDLLAGEGAVCPHTDIVAMDLTLCPRQKAVTLGTEGELFASSRIDDLECAYTTLRGFLGAKPRQGVAAVWAMLDNEEVGSGSSRGALGNMLLLSMNRIAEALGMTLQQTAAARAGSFALSCDNAHAVHPAHPEKSDPQNAPCMNGGVVLKWAANQSYATNALSGAVFRELCAHAGVPVQDFANPAGQPGGSTLGNLQNRTLGMPMADIGLAQLAMHSCVETAGTMDAYYMVSAVREFYNAELELCGGGYRIG